MRTPDASRRRTVVALGLAALVGGGLFALLFLWNDPFGAGNDTAGRRSPGSGLGPSHPGDDGRELESEVAESAQISEGDTSEGDEDSAPQTPPLLQGTVRGAGAPVEGALVRLVATDDVEKAIRRLSSQGGGDVLELATRVPELLSAVRNEIQRLRQESATTETDQDGVYAFHDLPGGSYFVLVTAEDWLFQYGDVVALSTERTETLDAALHRGSTIAGRVVDARGAGVAGVVVVAELRPAGESGLGRLIQRGLRFINGELLRGPFEATSAEDGTFTLASLLPGTYDLVAQKHARPEVRLEEVETGTMSALIYLGDPAWVEGQLVDKAGVPAIGVHLELEDLTSKFTLPLPAAGFSDVATNIYRWLGDEKPVDGESNTDGAFRLGPLAAGSYRLVCREPGFLPFKRTFSVEWSQRQDLGALYLDRGREIRGLVLDENGDGVAGAHVVAVSARLNPLMAGGAVSDIMSRRTSAATNDEGLFQLHGLGPGAYRISASASGFASAVSGEVKTDSPEPVTLRLERGTELRGIVRTSDGEPLEGVHVRSRQNRTTTDSDGVFILDGVTVSSPGGGFPGFAGPARRVEEGEEEQSVTVRASTRGYQASSVEVYLSSPPKDLELTLEPAPVISGQVFAPDGDPLPASLVRLTPDMPDELPFFEFVDPGMMFLAATVSGPDGKFRLPRFEGELSQGSLRVVADHPLHARGRSATFRIDEAEEGELEVEVALEAAAFIRGTVTDGTQAVGGATIRLRRIRDGGGAQFGQFLSMLGLPRGGESTYSSQSGTFEYARLGVGEYAVRAERRGYTESTEERLTVGPGAELTVELIVSPGGTISGALQDTAGLSIADARIRLLRERDKGDREAKAMLETQRAFGGAYRSARTDPEGHFQFEGLADGTYTVLAEARGFLPAEKSGVQADESGLVLVAVMAATLRGVVQDAATGAPIAEFQVNVERKGDDSNPGERNWWKERQIRDAEGRFVRDDLVPGTHVVRATATRYLGVERQVVLAAGEEREISFPLGRGGIVRGQVLDAATGQPVPDARIAVSTKPPPKALEESSGPDVTSGGATKSESADSESTDDLADARAVQTWFRETLSGNVARSREDGFFELDAVPSGPQTIVVAHDNYVDDYKRGIEVAPGEELPLAVSLRRGLRLSGTVVDKYGVPTPRVMVFVRGTSDGTAQIAKTTFSDREGAFRLGGLEKGSYRLRAFSGRQPRTHEIVVEEDVSDYLLETATE